MADELDPEEGLDALELAEPTRVALASASIDRLVDLVRKTEADLLRQSLSREALRDVKQALAARNLSLGMMLPSDSAPVGSDPATAAAILAAEPRAIDALVAGDPRHWRALAEHLLLDQDAVASAAAIAALLEREPDVSHLLARGREAVAQVESQLFLTTITALRAVRAWLAGGVAAAFDPIHPFALEVRYEQELSTAEGVEAARSIVADVRRAAPPRPSLADALVLLARRAHEDGAHDEALAAATEAESLYAAAGDERAVRVTERLRGSALLSLERFDEAFAVLDPAMIRSAPSPSGASRYASNPDQRAEAIAEAATVATWASATTPEWVRALGGMAERTRRRELWKRFEANLVAMVDAASDPASDLEVVIRQAGQRELSRTVKAARKLAAARGLDPDSVQNPHFG